MTHAERARRLEALLLAFQGLWRPQPFKIETPAWCAELPALTDELLALDDAAVDRLTGDDDALIARLAGHVPEVGELAELIAFESAAPGPGAATPAGGNRFFTGIPGAKFAQIAAYAEAVERPVAPVLEWCAGKGHLGRLLAGAWGLPTVSLEIDAALCDEGERLARRAGLEARQGFLRADALDPASTGHLAGRHAVALHACGDLHRRLVVAAAEQGSPALDVAPCCYYRSASDVLAPMAGGELRLDRDDLRLAVTDTVTASPRLRRRSRRALAWKLGWVELRRALTGETGYRPFPPVPEAWLRDDFAVFIQRMLEREACRADKADEARASPRPQVPRPQVPRPQVPRPQDLARFEALGQARAAHMSRLQLVRLAFRRALEVWLLMDMAVFLEGRGYRVTVRPFCPPDLTPRNLLLSARLA